MELESGINEENYELLQKEALEPSRSRPRGELLREALQQHGSCCGAGFSAGFGVLFDYTGCRYEIGDRVKVGAYSVLGGERGGPERVVLEDDVSIGAFFSISASMNNNGAGVQSRAVRLKRAAEIEPRVTIAAGVTIGEGAYIHRGAVVWGDVPDYAVAAGYPAQIIGYRKGRNDD